MYKNRTDEEHQPPNIAFFIAPDRISAKQGFITRYFDKWSTTIEERIIYITKVGYAEDEEGFGYNILPIINQKTNEN
jgi:hypothetical protein